MPPDFWDSDPVADVEAKTLTQDEPRPDEVDFEPSRRSTPKLAPRHLAPGQEVTGKLTDDPRFAVMQSLFPGQIVEWQESEEVTDEEVTDEEVSEEGADEPSADDPDPDDPNGEVDGLN